jgi:hypothetical protein
VKIIDALRNDFTLEVLPGARPDAIARIDGRLAIGWTGSGSRNKSFIPQ